MDEEQLRELATELLDQLPSVIADELARDGAAAQLDTALAIPHGAAAKALRTALSATQETRDWTLERLVDVEDRRDLLDGADRSVIGLPGLTTGVGLHYVCPNGDYDRYVESLADDPGRCPYDNSTLARADD